MNKMTLDPTLCKEISNQGSWRHASRQCKRKPTKDGYCHQHHPDRYKERSARWEEGWKLENAARAANLRVTDLERAIINLVLSGAPVPEEAVTALRVAKGAALEATIAHSNFKKGGTK